MKNKKKFVAKQAKIIIKIAVIVFLIVFISGCGTTATGNTVGEVTDGDGPIAQLLGSRSSSLQIVGLLTILTLAPSILIMLTGFTRIVIVLSITRNAMGMQQMPPNQVIVALSLFLTFFVMTPVLNTINEQAIQPYIDGEITAEVALNNAEVPLREFMLAQTYKTDLEMFMSMAKSPPVENLEEVPISTIIPAFITSEIKRGFTIGFFIYIPFIVIDMVVASTLMAMGMMMLPPIVISLPFKILLFILVDGWTLTLKTVLVTFGASG